MEIKAGYWKKTKLSEEHKRKISNTIKEQHRNLLNYAMNNKKHSEETKRKMSLARRGEERYNWKGGMSTLNKQIFLQYKYRQWRSDIFSRDNFTCQYCGKTDVEAHHIKQFNLILKENNIKTVEQAENCEELWNINNGITLCKSCHKKETIKQQRKK